MAGATTSAVARNVVPTPTILVFDSGLGGLSVLDQVRRARPDASYVYAADDAAFPYGRLAEPVLVDGRFRLRGSVDLIEQKRGTTILRVTDHKIGKNRTTWRTVLGGGGTLQPVLYSLAVEQGLNAPVASGRLFYCTAPGGFNTHAQSIYEEGLRLSPTLITSGDQPVRSTMNLLLENTRSPLHMVGDVRALLGTLRAGEDRVRAFAFHEGIHDQFLAFCRECWATGH